MKQQLLALLFALGSLVQFKVCAFPCTTTTETVSTETPSMFSGMPTYNTPSWTWAITPLTETTPPVYHTEPMTQIVWTGIPTAAETWTSVPNDETSAETTATTQWSGSSTNLPETLTVYPTYLNGGTPVAMSSALGLVVVFVYALL